MTKSRQKRMAAPKQATSNEKTRIENLTFGGLWERFWGYAGPIITVVGFLFNCWPTVSITSGANLDSAQTFQTRFLITNTGAFPVRNVSFSCALVGQNVYVGALSSQDLAPIDSLASKETAARGCFSRSSDVDGAILKVEAHYSWPWIGVPGSTDAYFSAIKGVGGYVLEPEPDPKQRYVALRINGPPANP